MLRRLPWYPTHRHISLLSSVHISHLIHCPHSTGQTTFLWSVLWPGGIGRVISKGERTFSCREYISYHYHVANRLKLEQATLILGESIAYYSVVLCATALRKETGDSFKIWWPCQEILGLKLLRHCIFFSSYLFQSNLLLHKRWPFQSAVTEFNYVFSTAFSHVCTKKSSPSHLIFFLSFTMRVKVFIGEHNHLSCSKWLNQTLASI